MLYGILFKPSGLILTTSSILSGECFDTVSDICLSCDEIVVKVGVFESGSPFLHEDGELVHDLIDFRCAKYNSPEGNVIALENSLHENDLAILELPIDHYSKLINPSFSKI